MSESSEAPIVSSLSGDPDMLDLVEEFVCDLQDRAALLEAAVGDGDLAELTRLAHQLKGASGGYGFDVIGEVAASLERSAKASGSVADVTREVKELIFVCQRATAGPVP